MRVFVSWSKERSGKLASKLVPWLRMVIQNLDPWMSKEIEAGKKWGPEIGAELEQSHFAILCVTPENQLEPWLQFEAGACGKFGKARVVPYTLGFEPGELAASPITQFQGKRASETGTYEMLESLNSALAATGGRALEEPALKQLFEKFWPDLESVINACVAMPAPRQPERDERDLLTEVLENSRLMLRQVSAVDLIEEMHHPGIRGDVRRKFYQRWLLENMGPAWVAGIIREFGASREVRRALRALDAGASMTDAIEILEHRLADLKISGVTGSLADAIASGNVTISAGAARIAEVLASDDPDEDPE